LALPPSHLGHRSEKSCCYPGSSIATFPPTNPSLLSKCPNCPPPNLTLRPRRHSSIFVTCFQFLSLVPPRYSLTIFSCPCFKSVPDFHLPKGTPGFPLVDPFSVFISQMLAPRYMFRWLTTISPPVLYYPVGYLFEERRVWIPSLASVQLLKMRGLFWFSTWVLFCPIYFFFYLVVSPLPGPPCRLSKRVVLGRSPS